MKEKAAIESIPIDRLLPHPGNANRMSNAALKKLAGHIKRTGNYEPLIVRHHSSMANHYELINGHYRLMALNKLGVTCADCIVWKVDDTEADILLATLNRLCGKDVLEKRSKLIKSLLKQFDAKQLSSMVTESKKSIERLMNLPKQLPLAKGTEKAFLTPMVFYLNDDQLTLLDSALKSAFETVEGTKAQRKSKAIFNIAQHYLEGKDERTEIFK